jgi:hypothetical protein
MGIKMRKRLVIAAGCLVLAAATVTSSARAAWGCRAGASDHSVTHTWGNATEQEAREYTLQLCRGVHPGCHIIDCASGIDTQAEADAKWPLGGAPVKCIGNAKC